MNSAKRKNLSSAKKSASNEEKSSDQSRQSTLTRQSAKELKSLKDKILKNNEEIIYKKENDKEDTHIYDEVPLDLVNEIKAKNVQNITAEYSKPVKKQQAIKAKNVAQVQPFHVLPADLSMSNITTSNLISNGNNYENYEYMDDDNFENNYEKIDESVSLQKIGSESSLASSCLAEAENLEQELTKKVQNQRANSIKKCKLQQQQPQQIKNTSPSILANIGSPQLRTSQRVRNRQQSANSVNSTSSSITSSIISSSSKTKPRARPPFK